MTAQHPSLAAASAVASTPPALASLLTPLAGGSPLALCCAGVSPRALFGGGRSVNAEAPMSSRRELLPTTTKKPAVEPDVGDDEGDRADAAAAAALGDKRGSGLVAATHAVSFLSLFLRSAG